MSRRYIQSICILLLLLATAGYSIPAQGALHDKYSQEHPLVIVCDWDLPPYEFLDDNGNPAGFIIDVLSKILDRQKIPYTFVMKENQQIKFIFSQGEADMVVAPSFLLNDDNCHMSSNIICYYKTKAAMREGAPSISNMRDIPADKVVVLRKDGQIVAQGLQDINKDRKLEFRGPMEALQGVLSGKFDLFIWGEEPLKWKIKELNLEGLRISDIDVPIIELHIGSHDKELVNAVDDQFARLDQNGELDVLRDKWFHPERHHDNASPVYLYVAIAAILLLLLLFMLNRLASRKLKHIMQRNSEQTRVMNLALDLGGYMVSEYNPKKDIFKNLRGHLMDEAKNITQSFETLHADDRQVFQEKVEELKQGEGETNTSAVLLRRNEGTAFRPKWQYLTGNCIKERDEDDHTNYLLVAKDITREIEEEQSNRELAAKYLKAFDISLVAMAFYDKNGVLLEMNERMKTVVGADDKNQEFFYKTLLFEAPLFRGVLHPGMRETIHACQHMYYADLDLDKYLEYRIHPVIDEHDEVYYYAVTVREITAERNLYREQQAIQRQLKVTNEEVSKFETRMNYLLSNTKMFIWRSNFQKQAIEVYRNLHKVEKTIPFEMYLNSIPLDEREEVTTILQNPLMRNRSINLVRHYWNSPLTGQEAWLAVSGNPVFDKNGLSIGHFGVIRDVTKLMLSQEELRKETALTQQSGKQKAAFLANMTHEIRTPLNAIVGFSDLLHMAESTAERTEFIHIIRHNCDLLLRLIDDLLETSEMSQRSQSIQAEDIDFSNFFDEVCQTVAQRVKEPSVSFIKDNPQESFPARIDKERIQQVITNFVTNAVKYTREGHIKLGYKEEWREVGGEQQEGIFIYCEDTGAGIAKEQQAAVFDRFVKLNDYVQGTGLGLAICKSIAERCNGQIGLISEGQGKGCTFWLWVPRFLTSSNLTEEK